MLNTSQSADSQLMKPQNPLIFQESKPQISNNDTEKNT